jgi:hypothetical protein
MSRAAGCRAVTLCFHTEMNAEIEAFLRRVLKDRASPDARHPAPRV